MNEVEVIEFHLDGRSGVAPYIQLIQQVRQAMRLGLLGEGDQLPTVKDVVAKYDGTSLMNRVGHAFFKRRMRESNAIFGGEVTGRGPAYVALGAIGLAFVFSFVGFATYLTEREDNDAKLVELFSNEKQVTAKTPPTFIFQTNEDTAVPAENAVKFYLALRKAGVPAELHIYQKGPHGVGLDPQDREVSTWPDRLLGWLRVNGIIPQ
jgi:acetyl esterase/lipase